MGWQWLYILYYLQVVQWQTCTQANIYILESTVSMFMISDSYDMPFAGWASEKLTGNGTCMNSSTSKAEGPCGIASLRRLKQPVFCGSQASLRRMLAAGSTLLNTFPNRLNISHMIIWISYVSQPSVWVREGFPYPPWLLYVGLKGFKKALQAKCCWVGSPG